MTEFQSRRELRDAERQGLVPKPEQVFDLPTGQIKLPTDSDVAAQGAPEMAGVGDMLTRKRIREMERQGLLDPLTGAVPIANQTAAASNASASQNAATLDVSVQPARPYDEVLAETEEPITASINAIAAPVVAAELQATVVAPAAAPAASAPLAPAPVAPTDIFHNMAIDVNARKPRAGIIIGSIVLVLAAVGAAAYMLGIFK